MRIKNIYRGETIRFSDNSIRASLLKEYIHIDGLYSKLVNGGDPYEIVQRGIFNPILEHIAIPNKITHFISFSEKLERAIYYGKSNKWPFKADFMFDKITFYDDRIWEYTFFLIVDFDVSRMKPNKRFGTGVYDLIYNEGYSFHPSSCLLINVVEYLQNKKVHNSIKQFAINDAEWLVLPTDPLGTSEGNSALLKKSHEMRVLHFVDNNYFSEASSPFIK